jgi:hypothetical protein
MSYAWPPDPVFWNEEFPAATSGRTAPYLFKGIIPPHAANPGHLLAGLGAIRQAHADERPSGAKVRVYEGEDRRDDLVEQVLTAAAWPDGALVPWMQEIVGADRFSLVINNLETTCPELAAGLSTFVRSTHSGWGVPIGGSEQVAFAGNYAGTAFGVHEGYEDAFLIHLGPNRKSFYCWDPKLYRDLTGGDEPKFGDYQDLLEQGEHFLLEPGDALFLPRRVFHVGTQDTFSISVAVPFYTYPVRRILRKEVLPRLLDEVLAEGPGGNGDADGVPSEMYPLTAGPDPAAKAMLPIAHDALAAAGPELLGTISEVVREYWELTQSNGGWEAVEHDIARDLAAAAFDADALAPGAAVRVLAPYQLCVGTGRVYLRGLEADCEPADLPGDLVAALALGGSATVPDDVAAIKALRALGATGGLQLTPAATATATGREDS